MTNSLLDTKLYAPRRRTGLVPRPQLADRVQRGTQSKLTLVSAPAGFGKSTVLAESLDLAPTDGPRTAWLSLDAGDNDLVPFWTHVIAAMRTVAPTVGATALTLLESLDGSIDDVLASLLNELNALSHDLVLVLDDYHAIDAPEIQTGMAFLLEHLPAQVHLVIATRADPALPLARLRARGELTEIRAVDLRFTPDEAGALLNGVMSLGLTAQDVAVLEGRTEGWIAAIQLAGLSMQGRDDIAGFIARFSGDDRYIVDYLVEEVLERQPEPVRAFLLETSILSRLNGALSDTVTGQDGGKAMLEALERQNLLLIPLDDRREWYRYHHLFADVLQARLKNERPEHVAELHRRSSEWYEQHGERAEAIRHAMAGKDFERAATLVELAIPAIRQSRQEATALAWLKALPDEVIATRPVLSVHYAGALLLGGELEAVEAKLRDAERWVDATGDENQGASAVSAPPIVANQAEFRELPTAIAVFRAAQALTVGDVTGTIRFARRALEVVADDDYAYRASAEGFLGIAAWRNGDLTEAHRRYVACAANLERAGFISDTVGCAISLADIRIAQGRLGDALSTLERGLERATPLRAPVVRGAADMHTGMAEVFLERDELDAATKHLVASAELGGPAALEQNPYRWRVAMALVRMAEGDLDATLGLLEEADHQSASHFLPQVRPVAALRARVWLRQGRLAEARRWANDTGLSSEDELVYLREFEHVTVARLILAEGSRDRLHTKIGDAIGLLERLRVAAEEGGRTGSVIEILVVQALARRAGNDVPGALAALERAAALAEPEKYVRVFAHEGPEMAGLLRVAIQQRGASDYLRWLLAATVTPRPHAPSDQPLSERELDVLRLLESELGGPDIARELTLSLATVRTHTGNIYAKLGVNNRRAAVRRAAELGLLSRSRDGRPSA